MWEDHKDEEHAIHKDDDLGGGVADEGGHDRQASDVHHVLGCRHLLCFDESSPVKI